MSFTTSFTDLYEKQCANSIFWFEQETKTIKDEESDNNKKIPKKTYFISTDKLFLTQAEWFCKVNGGQLPEIRSENQRKKFGSWPSKTKLKNLQLVLLLTVATRSFHSKPTMTKQPSVPHLTFWNMVAHTDLAEHFLVSGMTMLHLRQWLTTHLWCISTHKQTFCHPWQILERHQKKKPTSFAKSNQLIG